VYARPIRTNGKKKKRNQTLLSLKPRASFPATGDSSLLDLDPAPAGSPGRVTGRRLVSVFAV